MPSDVPGVTIVIPCYNRGDYLAECLESVRRQTVADWIAIVVDDASTEGDAAGVAGAQADGRIRVVRHEVNRGVAAARNTGFRLATAPLLLPLDSDDILTPTFLEKTVAALEAHPEANCAFTHFQLFGASDSVYHYHVQGIRELLDHQWLPGPGTLMRREVWEKAGGYCEDAILRWGNEDWDFWLTVAEQELHPVCVPEPLYLYRMHPGSMTNVSLLYYAADTRAFVYQRHRALFDTYGAGPEFLTHGFQRSCRGAWAKGEWARAAAMWWRWIMHRWRNRRTAPTPDRRNPGP